MSKLRRASAAPRNTVAFLYAHGLEVTPESLETMVQEAMVRLRRTLQGWDGLADLTEVEVEELRTRARDLGYGLV